MSERAASFPYIHLENPLSWGRRIAGSVGRGAFRILDRCMQALGAPAFPDDEIRRSIASVARPTPEQSAQLVILTPRTPDVVVSGIPASEIPTLELPVFPKSFYRDYGQAGPERMLNAIASISNLDDFRLEHEKPSLGTNPELDTPAARYFFEHTLNMPESTRFADSVIWVSYNEWVRLYQSNKAGWKAFLENNLL